MTIRPAEPADAQAMREVAFAAKSHWGYEPELVRSWADGLTFTARASRWVAEDDGVIVAWAALLPPQNGAAVLDDLWVAPSAMGRGLGRRLFDLAAARARELGATRLQWGADPNAVPFYERVGGRVVGEKISEWGRTVPRMEASL